MKVQVKYFGAVAEVTGKNEEEFVLDKHEIDSLTHVIKHKYDLSGIDYSIALNRKIITLNKDLQSEDEVALLPPFAGG